MKLAEPTNPLVLPYLELCGSLAAKFESLEPPPLLPSNPPLLSS